MRLENGSMQFFEESIDPGYYGHVVLLAPGEMLKVEEDIPMEKILEVRREAKRKVFVRNAVRALKIVAPEHDLRKYQTWCWLAVPLRTLRFRKCLQKPLQNTGSSVDVEISGEQRVRETQWPQVC